MKSFRREEETLPRSPNPGSRLIWALVIGFLLVVLIAVLMPRSRNPSSDRTSTTNAPPLANAPLEGAARIASARRGLNFGTKLAPVKTAEEIVAGKLAQFARSRRQLAYALARRHGVEVPDAVKRFFDAVETGNWDEIQARFKAINGGDFSASHGGGRPPGVNELWSAIVDAYGVAEQVHLWPAQKLLDYGNAVLDSLGPGMVYVGGTDNGRWIPELLNDTGDGENHIIVTQNALADSMYLEYVTQLYGDRLANLTQEDSQRAFQEYLADAQQRLQHDQQFPDEPKQVRPGENITDTDGKIQVSGQVAVMMINERLLQTLLQKNPDTSFAVQESYPMTGTYANALPLGPLMELRAQDAQNTFTPERAAQSVEYWSNTAENVLSDPEAAGSAATLKSYSHDANSAANLLAANGYDAEAEQAYRLSSQLCPFSPEAVGGLANILSRTGHADEASRLLDDFALNYPEQRPAIEAYSASILWTSPSAKPQP